MVQHRLPREGEGGGGLSGFGREGQSFGRVGGCMSYGSSCPVFLQIHVEPLVLVRFVVVYSSVV